MKNTTVDVLLKVGRLKSIKRTGWVRSGMPDPESVAAHTFRVCFLVLVLADRLKLNRQKLLEMGLLHDIEEAVTGDPVTQRGMDQIGEHDVEEEGNIVRRIFLPLENRDELYKIWEAHLPENKPGASREARILYEIGKIATAWQALEYELAGQDPMLMDEWWVNARTYVKEPLLIEILDALEIKRKQLK